MTATVISYTLHTVDCASAVELGAPIAASADYPDARKHRCVYYADPLPAQVRVTSIEGEIPPHGEKVTE